MSDNNDKGVITKDAELIAIHGCLRALDGLDTAAHKRVLEYVSERLAPSEAFGYGGGSLGVVQGTFRMTESEVEALDNARDELAATAGDVAGDGL